MTEVYPVLPLVLGVLLCPFVGRVGRNVLTVLAPLVALYFVFVVPEGAGWTVDVIGREVRLWRVDALSRIFAIAFTLYGALAGLYAWSERGVGRKVASLVQVVGGTGIVFAGDLWSLLLFWEMLTASSLFVIWFGDDRQATRAGFRYLYIHLAGGVCLLGGAIMVGGELSALQLDGPASWLILIGLVTNAAVPPLHAWLPDAYPRASIYGTVYLAAFTTKAAVYVLARVFPDTGLLAWAGSIMAIYGVLFAILENDIRRLLAYHIVSQVGFMVAGVGMAAIGTKAGDLALNGATAHAVCHIFYKGLLMMSVGAVIYATGRGRLTELGGVGRSMGLTFLFCVVGAFSISGVPMFNGYVSKSMTISAAGYRHLDAINLMLTVASVGTFLSVAMKLVYFTFMGAARGAAPARPVPLGMNLAMGVSAVICVVTGLPSHLGPIHNPLSYELLYAYLPMQGHQPIYHPHNWAHFIGTAQLLLATAVAFWLIRHVMAPKPKISLDVDRLYRRPTRVAVDFAGGSFEAFSRASGLFFSGLIDVGLGLLAMYRTFKRQVTLAYQVLVIVAVFAVLGYVVITMSP